VWYGLYLWLYWGYHSCTDEMRRCAVVKLYDYRSESRQCSRAAMTLSLCIYAPPSLFAYSSSIASSYRFSASNSSCVFCVWLALATLCVDAVSTLCAVCAVAGALVDFSVVEGMGTGIVCDNVVCVVGVTGVRCIVDVCDWAWSV
jgi:hypothetical protein